MNLTEAKARLTIADLWRHLAFAGEPSKSCRCPFHEDGSASFSVFPGKDGFDAFNCFAGCGGGDAVDFLALTSGLPHPDACRAFIELAGGSPLPATVPRRARSKATSDAEKAAQRKTWPPFTPPLTSETGSEEIALSALAALRHVSLAGVKLMAARGLLWFTAWKDSPAWVVTDGARVNAQVRRMDGKLWPAIGKKAQTLPGSCAAWPIGAESSKPFPVVLLVEGGPDLLAAHHWIHTHGREGDTAAVGVLGSSNTIPADALAHFAAKRVRIMAHADDAGREAARRWKGQLDTVGARVDAADFTGLLMADGQPVKDLNDCTQLRPEDQPQLEDLIPHENLEP